MKQRSVLLLVLWLFLSPFAFAGSPSGLWTTIDDKTGKKRAIVLVSVINNTLTARIVRVYHQPGDTGLCSKCPGAFKGKPIKGIQFVWGLKGHGKNKWEGGRILDPKTGKIYHVKMTLKGKKLHVRAYVGFSVIGRNQVWIR